jgi:uncharacterized protein
MRVGLLSDSHGQALVTRRAVELLCRHEPDCLIHLGDIMSSEVIDALLQPALDGPGVLPVHVVMGNCDFKPASLTRYARDLGVMVDDPVGRLECDGREVVFLHGHDGAALTAALQDRPAYLCHGHTHQRRDDRIGPTRLINPGALHRAAVYSAAVLDTQADSLQFLEIPRL